MGMFDYVKCDHPLPDGWVSPRGVYLTKDLTEGLDEYTVTAGGRLLKLEFDLEDDGPEREHTLFKGLMIQPKKRVNERLVDTEHHGDVTFYDHEERDADDKEKRRFVFHTYTARFTNGQLQEITVKLEKYG